MKKQPPKKGFGFGDAMFAMKNLTSEYGNIDDAPSRPIEVKPKNSPSLIKKESKARPVSNVVQVANEKKMQNLGFKVSPGQEFVAKLEMKVLQITKCQNKIYEITHENIVSKWDYVPLSTGLPSEIIVPGATIDFNFSPFEVKQGYIGDCYFVCALIGLLQLNSILRNRITLVNPNKHGFKINLFESGKNVEINISDLFESKYCHPVGNSIAPMVMEKAFAQIYGGYEAIVMGSANDALRDLSGAPTEYLDLKDKKNVEMQLEEALRKKYPMVIASKKNPINESISGSHSYNIVDFTRAKGEIFLCMRDPRGWSKACFNVPASLSNNLEMGIFWVSLAEIERSFEVISICKASENANYFYHTFSNKDLIERKGALKFTLTKPSEWSISIHQKQKKFFPEGHQYDIIRILVAEISPNKDKFEIIKTIKMDFNSRAVCTLNLNLEPGSYVVLSEIGTRKEKNAFPREIFTLSFYGEGDISFEQIIGRIEIRPFLIDYLKNHEGEFNRKVTPEGLARTHFVLFGYVCIYYENNSAKKVSEEVEYGGENYEVTEKKVLLYPNDCKLLLHPIYPMNNCSHRCTFNAKTLYS